MNLSRELVASWLATGALVLLVYLTIVAGGTWLLGGGPTPRLALSLLATVLVAVGIEPLHRRLHSATARRLARPTTEPYEVLSTFHDRLAGAESVDDMTARMAQTLGTGIAAAWVQVWLMVRDELQLVAAWPPDTATDPVPPPAAAMSEHGVHSLPVGHGSEILGVLRVREQEGRVFSGAEQRLFAGLAGQAGLLLANARLRLDLQEQVQRLSARTRQLRSARAELVTAADVERRRLERNLHDGAQQELVALSINLGLARAVVGSDSEFGRRLLLEQADAAHAAIETLTTLARGLGPTTLITDGLAAALSEMARTIPLATHVEAPDSRYAPETEAALYYCASEAVQNAVKHSGGTRISIVVEQGAATLVLTVTDNGSGVGSVPAGAGTGIRGMQERASQVGGSVLVGQARSHAGSGTSVTVSVPLDHALEPGA
ncbi:GAF domain-containing sensor histidine kinase [Terrabacter koreensis]